MTKGKNNKVVSSHIRFGRRSYFFNVNTAVNDKKYLRIIESQFMGEGKERIFNSFVLFPEDVELFQKNLEETTIALQG